MPFRKLNSKMLDKAEVRLAGLRVLALKRDLKPIDLPRFKEAVERHRGLIAQYNALLSGADMLKSEIRHDEKLLREEYALTTKNVAGKFGGDSPEYAAVGGVTTQEKVARRVASQRRNRQAREAAAAAQQAEEEKAHAEVAKLTDEPPLTPLA